MLNCRTRKNMLVAVLVPLLLPANAVKAGKPEGTAYVSNQQGGVSVLNLNTLEKLRDLETGGTGPRGIGVTGDGKYVLTANKDTSDMSVIDTASGKLLKRVEIGKNPEFLRVFRGKVYVTYEPAVNDGPPSEKKEKLEGPPAAIAVVDIKTWRVERVLPSGQEAEGTEFSADGSRMLVANEGDNAIAVYELPSGKQIKSIPTLPHGERPRGIKASPDGKSYVITLEGSDKLLLLDKKFNVVKTVETKKTPYGLAFDRSGKRLFVVTAKAKELQVFDTRSYQQVTSIPVGDRCWHFTLTPAEDRLLVVCGRSNDVQVIDTKSSRVEKVVDGFRLPWGIVTYPSANGSLQSDARH